LCQAQQREAGLRLAALAARPAISLLGNRELSAQAMHFARLVGKCTPQRAPSWKLRSSHQNTARPR
jgi:hypothetical protein